MSADLLRRAADRLRTAVQHIHPEWRDREWFPVLTDSESLTGVRTCAKTHAPDAQSDACDWCDDFETYSEPLAAFIALMGPPVALALAEWLDDAAGSVDARVFAERHVGLADGAIKTSAEDAALAVALAVLREDDGGTS